MRSTKAWMLAGAVLLSAAACGGDDSRTTEQPATAGSAARTPAATTGTSGQSSFIQDQLALARKQQGLAELAVDRATRPEVKALAQSFLQDQEETYGSLRQLAEQQSVTVPEPQQLRTERERLSQLSGAQFDREYLVEIIADHERAVTAIEEAARSGDAQVKEWASRALPRVRRHLGQAQQLHASNSPR